LIILYDFVWFPTPQTNPNSVDAFLHKRWFVWGAGNPSNRIFGTTQFLDHFFCVSITCCQSFLDQKKHLSYKIIQNDCVIQNQPFWPTPLCIIQNAESFAKNLSTKKKFAQKSLSTRFFIEKSCT
jgi:hypothetical protein